MVSLFSITNLIFSTAHQYGYKGRIFYSENSTDYHLTNQSNQNYHDPLVVVNCSNNQRIVGYLLSNGNYPIDKLF